MKNNKIKKSTGRYKYANAPLDAKAQAIKKTALYINHSGSLFFFVKISYASFDAEYIGPLKPLASCSHALMQAVQAIHFFISRFDGSFLSIASIGQISMHLPQPIQSEFVDG